MVSKLKLLPVIFIVASFWVSGLAEAQELKLLSLNVWQFPEGIESTRNIERATKLTDIIREKEQDFDVIAFQELWSNETREYIRNRIKKYYRYKFEDNQPGA